MSESPFFRLAQLVKPFKRSAQEKLVYLFMIYTIYQLKTSKKDDQKNIIDQQKKNPRHPNNYPFFGFLEGAVFSSKFSAGRLEGTDDDGVGVGDRNRGDRRGDGDLEGEDAVAGGGSSGTWRRVVGGCSSCEVAGVGGITATTGG